MKNLQHNIDYNIPETQGLCPEGMHRFHYTQISVSGIRKENGYVNCVDELTFLHLLFNWNYTELGTSYFFPGDIG